LLRLQQRILETRTNPFAFHVTEAAIEQLLAEGTDPRYGARHLRRAIDRLLVQPISNLLASDQLRGGDCVLVDSDPATREMTFSREAEGLSPQSISRVAQTPLVVGAAGVSAPPEEKEPSGIMRRFKVA
jgi:ATP-dependent Clp protease ATP-binding subunit ClpB